MATEAQMRANHKYRSKAYDRLELQLKKGLRDRWRASAEAKGLSLTAYIVQVMEAAEAAQASLDDNMPEP